MNGGEVMATLPNNDHEHTHQIEKRTACMRISIFGTTMTVQFVTELSSSTYDLTMNISDGDGLDLHR